MIKQALRIKEIKTLFMYILLVFIVLRIGSWIPVPFINRELINGWTNSNTLLDLFSGGALSNVSIFAVGIAPYITASIIIELLSVVFPRIAELKKDGKYGQDKVKRITIYAALIFATLQSVTMSISFGRQNMLTKYGFIAVALSSLTMILGSAILVFIAEKITKTKLANGMSLILLFNILSRVPQIATGFYEQFIKGQSITKSAVIILAALAIMFGLIWLIVTMDDTKRNVPVQYSGKIGHMTRKQNLPIKLNAAGVIPVIFASSLMQFPQIIMTLIGRTPKTEFGIFIAGMLNESNWFKISKPFMSVGAILFILLIIFFGYFYTGIQMNPIEMAENIKKNGGTIPGIRPGRETANYISNITKRTVLAGSIALASIAILPTIINGLSGANIAFAGTSMIIACGVIKELYTQVTSIVAERTLGRFL